MPLNPRQQRFVDEYLVDLNGAQAAIRAGYARKFAKSMARQLFQNAEIKSEIDRRKLLRSAEVGLTAREVLAELRLLVLSDIEHYSLGDDERIIVDPSAPPGARRAVSRKKLTRRTLQHGPLAPDQVAPTEVTAEIWLWDKVSAIRMAMDHLGLSKQLTLETVLALLPGPFGEAVRRHLAGDVPDGSEATGAGSGEPEGG